MTNKKELLERRIKAITEQLKEAVDVSLLLYGEGDLDRKEITEAWAVGANEVAAHIKDRSQHLGQNILSWLPLSKLFNLY
jgi:hypothetical protein